LYISDCDIIDDFKKNTTSLVLSKDIPKIVVL
jgi:hypothetical protein